MKTHTTDVIVLGLGAMGSATLYQLAQRDVDVLGIDRYSPPHHFGSTHGDTRVTRLAIGEGTAYMPLVARSHEIWRDLEAETRQSLLHQCGGIIFGDLALDSIKHHGVANFLKSTMDAARLAGIEHEVLDDVQLRETYPQFEFNGGEQGYYEHGAGYVFPERCVSAQLNQARTHGAQIHTNTRIEKIKRVGSSFQLLAGDHAFESDQLVITAGPWLSDLIESSVELSVYRQLLFWFEPTAQPKLFHKDHCPIFIWVTETPSQLLYGFPEITPGGGVKVASESYLQTTHPDRRQLEVTEDEIDEMRAFMSNRMPLLTGRCVKAVSCLYTCTPSFDFLIDHHPEWKNCMVVSACSGHGFKHSAAIGECVSQVIVDGTSPIDLSEFTFASR